MSFSIPGRGRPRPAARMTSPPLGRLRHAVMLACLCAASSVPAAQDEADRFAEDRESVGELMRLETQLALRRARQRLRDAAGEGQGPPAAAGNGTPGQPFGLIGIYGVGRRLMAEVMAGSRPLLFMQGSPWPIGQKGGGTRLRGIAGTCVTLEHEGRAHTLCARQSRDGQG